MHLLNLIFILSATYKGRSPYELLKVEKVGHMNDDVKPKKRLKSVHNCIFKPNNKRY